MNFIVRRQTVRVARRISGREVSGDTRYVEERRKEERENDRIYRPYLSLSLFLAMYTYKEKKKRANKISREG